MKVHRSLANSQNKGIFICSLPNLNLFYSGKQRYLVEFSTDLKALIRSHEADDHFDRAGVIPFASSERQFSAANAWWLAELSRWMYVGKRMPAHMRQRPQAILDSVDLEERGYFTANGIHAALVSAKDQSHSVLVFRGTSQLKNWATHANVRPLRNNAHRGYENALDAIWPSLGPILDETPGTIYFTGHSMGGALAALSARRFDPTAVYTFGAPPIGNQKLAEQYRDHLAPVYRLVNYRDVVSRFPLAGSHVGEMHYLKHDHSLAVAPAPHELISDQRLGPRSVMCKLNEKKWVAIPERICDHSPQNYVANLERVNLGFWKERKHSHLTTGNVFGFSANNTQPAG